MKKLLVLSLAVMAASMFSGCEGGGGLANTGHQCVADYNPVPMSIPVTESYRKIEWDEVTNGMLPPGTYSEIGANLYYVDSERAPNDNFRLSVTHAKDSKSGQLTAQVGCARNAREGLENTAVSIEGVSELRIDNSNKVANTEARPIGFRIDETGRVVTKVNDAQNKPGEPGKVYDKLESFIYRRNDTDYEIRSTGTTERGKYSLSVVLQRQPLPTCAPGVNPIPLKAVEKDWQPIEWAKAGEQIPAGTYEEVSSRIYYEQDGQPLAPFAVQAKDEVTPDGGHSSETLCARGVRQDLPGLTLVTDVVRRLRVGADKRTWVDPEVRRFSFKMQSPLSVTDEVFNAAKKLRVRFKKEESGDDHSAPPPSSLGVSKEITAYKVNETDYQVRVSGRVESPGQSGTYYLSVLLRRTP